MLNRALFECDDELIQPGRGNKGFSLDIENRDQKNIVLPFLVIGLGQLGLPVAIYAQEKGFDTCGYDISASNGTGSGDRWYEESY